MKLFKKDKSEKQNMRYMSD